MSERDRAMEYQPTTGYEAAAKLATTPEEKVPCDNCQMQVDTVRVPTGFSGESEILCGPCIGKIFKTEYLDDPTAELISREKVGARLRYVATKYLAGGHSHRAQMLNALADEFNPQNAQAKGASA